MLPVLSKIGDRDGASGAQVTEQMIRQVFASANDIICLRYSKLGIDEGDQKMITIEKPRKGGITFKVITNTSTSPARTPLLCVITRLKNVLDHRVLELPCQRKS